MIKFTFSDVYYFHASDPVCQCRVIQRFLRIDKEDP